MKLTWEIGNKIMLAAVLVLWVYLIISEVRCFSRRKKPAKPIGFAFIVFILNLALYIVPWSYEVTVLNEEKNIVMCILESISDTIKQFVGEFRTDTLVKYAKVYPEYNTIFVMGAVLALSTTFSVAIGVFGHDIINRVKLGFNMHIRSGCDMVVGTSPTALNYAKKNKHTILVINDAVEKDFVETLVEEGYTVLKRKLSPKFLKSRYFYRGKKYNVIFPMDGNDLNDSLNTILTYLEIVKKEKKMRFYLELDETIMEMVYEQIAKKEDEDKTQIKYKCFGKKERTYREHITLFSKNELVAREVVGKNPITKYMPKTFLDVDTSVKEDVTLNAFFIGFGPLNREIYKQFVINNQLVKRIGDEYRVFPVKYFIYDDKIDRNEWGVDGLKTALDGCVESPNMYFPIPDLPYETECINTSINVLDYKTICDKIKGEKKLSYIFVDVGDGYINIDIAERFKRYMDNGEAYHIFVYNEAVAPGTDEGDKTTYFGEPDAVYSHNVIVNESLVGLAKKLNEAYLNFDGMSQKQRKLAADLDWARCPYINVYSNIYLANSLSFKLDLLGLSYVESDNVDAEANEELYKKHYDGYERRQSHEMYAGFNRRNALAAQEHCRWNAYYMMNEYRPMNVAKFNVTKKEEKKENGQSAKLSLGQQVKKLYNEILRKKNESAVVANEKQQKELDRQRRTSLVNTRGNKNHKSKVHVCLTTQKGLFELSEYIRENAAKLYPEEKYEAGDFSYFSNDELLYSIIPEYLSENGYKLIEKE